MNIPIFTDEDIIREFISDVLKLNFNTLRIEEIMEITKTPKYKVFANSYKIESLQKRFHFPVDDRLRQEVIDFLSKPDFSKIQFGQSKS